LRTLWIGLAGFCGATSRYHLEGWVSNRWPTAFPWGTFVVNVSGCLVLGFIFTLLTERLLPHPDIRTALTIGFVGAYTTFSTFAFETLRLGEEGAVGLALANVVASVAAGIAAMWFGTVIGRTL
jgi:CrcB protein